MLVNDFVPPVPHILDETVDYSEFDSTHGNGNKMRNDNLVETSDHEVFPPSHSSPLKQSGHTDNNTSKNNNRRGKNNSMSEDRINSLFAMIDQQRKAIDDLQANQGNNSTLHETIQTPDENTGTKKGDIRSNNTVETLVPIANNMLEKNYENTNEYLDSNHTMTNRQVLALLEKARSEGKNTGISESKHTMEKALPLNSTESKKSLKRKRSEWMEQDETDDDDEVLGPFGEIKKIKKNKDRSRLRHRYRDSDDSSDEEYYYQKKNKSNKYADRYFSERTKRKVSWPNHYVRRRGEKIEYSELNFPEFACGAFRICEATLPKTKENRFVWDLLSYLGNLFEASKSDGLEILKTCHKQILVEIENGVLNNKDWLSWDTRRKELMTELNILNKYTPKETSFKGGDNKKKNISSGSNNSSGKNTQNYHRNPKSLSCNYYNANTCRMDDDHENNKTGGLWLHVCAYCLKSRGDKARHREGNCPFKRNTGDSKNYSGP